MIAREGCIFCCIGDASDRIVAESRTVFVRRDKFPATAGHLHVVPKRHVVSFINLTDQETRELFSMVQSMQLELDEEYSPDGYNIGINEGPASGASFEHLHIHLIPRYTGDHPNPGGGIRRGLPNGHPDHYINRKTSHDPVQQEHRQAR